MNSFQLNQKKGEITISYIVLITVLIISFIIILFFVVKLNLGSSVPKEICHNSIVLASKNGIAGLFLKNAVNCEVNYLCISGGRDCNERPASQTVYVSLNKPESELKKEIMKAIAEEMVDCWWMYGEGKIQYVSENFATTKIVCSACSRIEFDDSLSKMKMISYQEFYDYLRTTKKSEDKTYLQYLYGSNELINIKPTLLKNYLYESSGENEGDWKKRNIVFTSSYYLITGLIEKSTFSEALDAGFGADEVEEYYPIKPVLLPEDSPDIQNIGCGSYITKAA